MRHLRSARVLVAFCTVLALAGCGGGGHGFAGSLNPIQITNTSLPVVLSGQQVNYAIPTTGGGGGPYLMEVLDGSLPPGIALDPLTIGFTGRPLAFGTFSFTLKVTDMGSNPPTTTIVDFVWVVDEGPMVFLGDTSLPAWIYNDFNSVVLPFAGGVPPYSSQVIDGAPLDDGPLPLGLAISPGSTAVAGSPYGTLPTPAPYVYQVTIRTTDSASNFLDRTFTITVLVPPIVITTTSLANGKCGTLYNDKIEILDGIPPFLHSVVPGTALLPLGVDPYSVRAKGQPGSLNGGAKGVPTSAYADDTDPGASGFYNDRFPEGMYLRDGTGDLTGVPRRTGTFQNWKYFIQSTVLPIDPSQNATKLYTFSMTDSAPPAVAIDADNTKSTILAANGGFAPPNNYLVALEKNVPYNRKFEGVGGITHDAKYDDPHESNVTSSGTPPGEVPGKYAYSATFLAGLPPGMNPLTSDGVWTGTPTTKFGFTGVTVSIWDAQLPTVASPPPAAPHGATATFQFESGPDTVILTETTGSVANVNPDQPLAYNQQTLEIMEGSTVRKVNTAADFVVGQPANPTYTAATTGTQLGFSNIDFLTLTANPTWWAYDNFNLNERAARGGQHADPERRWTYCGDGYAGHLGLCVWSAYRAGYGYTAAAILNGPDHASDNAIELPTAPTVGHSPGTGVYADGGLMYAFSREPTASTGEFGILIVRKNGKVYVPVSLTRSATQDGFGDGWLAKGVGANSILQRPQITVSPDGRFAAMKLKQSVSNFLEGAANSKIVVFSLTGESTVTGWGGAKSIVIGSGASGSNGNYLYADSMTLTNRYLYWLTGLNGSSTTYISNSACGGHYIWKYDLFATYTGSNVGALIPSPSPTDATNWPSNGNTAGSPMGLPFHGWTIPSVASIYNAYYGGAYWYYVYMFSPCGIMYGYQSASGPYPAPEFYAFNLANFSEAGGAQHPFRVSRDGKACAIVTSYNATNVSYYQSQTGSSTLQMWLIYVDFWDGNFPGVTTMRKATANVRHWRSSGRGGMTRGDKLYGNYSYTSYYAYYGTYQFSEGPNPQVEISDNGKAIAAVYNTTASTVYTYQTANTSNQLHVAREELNVLFATSASTTDPWATSSERGVTTDYGLAYNATTNVTSTPSPAGTNAIIFYSSYYWRHGCLAFTRDGNGLVFWSGASNYSPSSGSYLYTWACHQTGSLYAVTFSGVGTTAAAIATRQHILSPTDGGVSAVSSTPTTITNSSSSWLPSFSASWSASLGAIYPAGNFYSNDGRFFYVRCRGALNSSNPTGNRLVGVNVAYASGSAINGRTPLLGFAPSWDSGNNANLYRRGFGPIGERPAPSMQTENAAGDVTSTVGNQASVAGTGKVFFAGYYQQATSFTGSITQSNYPTSSYYYVEGGGPAYATSGSDWGCYDGQIFCFDANVGGNPFLVTSLPSGSYRQICYLQPNADGTRLGFVAAGVNTSTLVTSSGATTYMWDHYNNQEMVGVCTNLSTDAAGNPSGTPAMITLESTLGRAGVSMALDASNTRLFYSFGNGSYPSTTTANENATKVIMKVLNGAGTAAASTTALSGGLGGAGGTGRFAVLLTVRN